MKKLFFIIITFIFFICYSFSNDYLFYKKEIKFFFISNNVETGSSLQKSIFFHNIFLFKYELSKKIEIFNYKDHNEIIRLYDFNSSNINKENPFRRAEILFFGTLTFASFGGWLFFSLFNFLIYDEAFGRLKREQFLTLYLGSTVVSISVVLSDIFISREKKIKNVIIY